MIFSSPYNARIPEIPIHEAILFNINQHEHKVALVSEVIHFLNRQENNDN